MKLARDICQGFHVDQAFISLSNMRFHNGTLALQIYGCASLSEFQSSNYKTQKINLSFHSSSSLFRVFRLKTGFLYSSKMVAIKLQKEENREAFLKVFPTLADEVLLELRKYNMPEDAYEWTKKVRRSINRKEKG